MVHCDERQAITIKGNSVSSQYNEGSCGNHATNKQPDKNAMAGLIIYPYNDRRLSVMLRHNAS